MLGVEGRRIRTGSNELEGLGLSLVVRHDCGRACRLGCCLFGESGEVGWLGDGGGGRGLRWDDEKSGEGVQGVPGFGSHRRSCVAHHRESYPAAAHRTFGAWRGGYRGGSPEATICSPHLQLAGKEREEKKRRMRPPLPASAFLTSWRSVAAKVMPWTCARCTKAPMLANLTAMTTTPLHFFSSSPLRRLAAEVNPPALKPPSSARPNYRPQYRARNKDILYYTTRCVCRPPLPAGERGVCRPGTSPR